jgi:hypothetical protein
MPRLWIVVPLIAVASKCFPVASIQPFYHATDVVRDTAFEGRWISEDSCCVAITPRSDGSYLWHAIAEIAKTETDQGKHDVILHFTRIDGVLYADARDVAAPHGGSDAQHMIVRVDQLRPTLHLAFFSPDSTLMASGELPHTRGKDHDVVLTASTDQLRRLVARYAHDPDQWEVIPDSTNSPLRYVGPP